MEVKHREYIRWLKDEYKKRDEVSNWVWEQSNMEIEDLRELMRRNFDNHQNIIENCTDLEIKLAHKWSKVKLLKDKISLMEDFEGWNKADLFAKSSKIEELEDELRVKVA